MGLFEMGLAKTIDDELIRSLNFFILRRFPTHQFFHLATL
jgi:hypothetical protein